MSCTRTDEIFQIGEPGGDILIFLENVICNGEVSGVCISLSI